MYLVRKMFLPRAEDVQISGIFVSRCFCQRPKKNMRFVYNPQINFFIHASIVSVLANLRYEWGLYIIRIRFVYNSVSLCVHPSFLFL